MPSDHEQLEKLIHVIKEALSQDEELRKKYQVGEKFKFIRDRLQSLLQEVQEGPSTTRIEQQHQPAAVVTEADEVLVYVHLYNAQGLTIRSWQSIVHPKAFFDYSVNRPIYKEKTQIEAFIHAKTNKAQHGYLTIAVKQDRLTVVKDEVLKDVMGQPLIKVKEGSLRPERLLSFTHNGLEYVLSVEGELIRKHH